MDISLILATYKRSNILNKTLESFCSLTTNNFTWELIIVDNADDHETCKVVDCYRNKLPIIFLTEVIPGKNNALNAALLRASGTLYVFTDDDVIADPAWLSEMWQGVLRWPNYYIFGGRILPSWPGGKAPSIIKRGDDFFYGAYAIADWDIPEGCYAPNNVYGANMAVRSKLFGDHIKFNSKIGPEAGKLYVMGSETEFLLRMENLGYQPIWLPNALVYHQIRENQVTSVWLNRRAYKYGKSKAVLNDNTSNCTLIFGMPRYLFMQTLLFFFQYLLAYISGNEKRKVQKGIKFYYILGMTHQLVVTRLGKLKKI